MSEPFPHLDFAPHWKTMNTNLIEIVELFSEEGLDWIPREGEWSARQIVVHLNLARYHGPIAEPKDLAHIDEAIIHSNTVGGIADELRISWAMLERFLSDPAKLDAVYDPSGDMDLAYVDEPESYTGHYIAYHRFAHDLHHRSTLIGHLSQLGTSLDGHRLRPL
jgi:hypothetical protein